MIMKVFKSYVIQHILRLQIMIVPFLNITGGGGNRMTTFWGIVGTFKCHFYLFLAALLTHFIFMRIFILHKSMSI